MNATFPRPTEPTTDALHAVRLVGSTSNHAYAGLFGFGLVTPSGEFALDAEQATADPFLLRLSSNPTANYQSPIEYTWIHDLGEDGYRVLRPIPVAIKRVDIGDFQASFREANIAMSGNDSNDALQALVVEILETFDVLLREHNLGPDAAEQRRILRTYIART